MFTRSKNNPILKPNKNHDWESRKVYNCGAIYKNNQYHLFYRAVGNDWISRLGYAVSKDGENFICSKKPLLFSKTDLEKRGLEDPRISKVNNQYFLTFTAYDGVAARLNFATSRNLKNWQKYGKILPNWDSEKANAFKVKWDMARNTAVAKKEWSKAGGIFPKIINNKYWILFGDSNIWLANSEDGLHLAFYF